MIGQELLEAEPELSEVNEDLICPVCLDVLHEPFQVDPCGHVFCEPCLRRLGQVRYNGYNLFCTTALYCYNTCDNWFCTPVLFRKTR